MALLRGDSAGQDLPSLRDLPFAKLGRFIISRLNAERERERDTHTRTHKDRLGERENCHCSIQGELRSVAGCVDVSHRKAYSAHGTYRSSSDISPLRLGTLPVIVWAVEGGTGRQTQSGQLSYAIGWWTALTVAFYLLSFFVQ